jgi:hypothetical protein
MMAPTTSRPTTTQSVGGGLATGGATTGDGGGGGACTCSGVSTAGVVGLTLSGVCVPACDADDWEVAPGAKNVGGR